MIKNHRSIIGTSVLHFDDGSLLAVLRDVIIDPDTGKIEAFWVKPLSLPIANAVIQSQDIVEWKKNIYLKNESVIADPADIIKVTDKKDASLVTFEEAKEGIVKMLAQRQKNKMIQDYVKSLRKEAKIVYPESAKLVDEGKNATKSDEPNIVKEPPDVNS